jgi:ribonuclease HI
MEDKIPEVNIYTDGGCRPNPGPGGWAAVLIEKNKPNRELSGGDAKTTNNRMEIQAAVEGLRALEGPHRVRLFTDSQYLRQGVTSWLPKWRENGWRTAGKKEVKNQDLWQILEAELDRHRVTWHWVKGHAGNRWNERADRLATKAIPQVPLPVDDPDAVHVFMAAAYSGKQKKGSWAVVLRYGEDEKVLSDQEPKTSANRMHLVGAVAGLRQLKRRMRVHMYTASDYLRDGSTAWMGGWKGRAWKTRDGRPVAHRDLWCELDELLQRHRIQWHVVDRDTMPDEMKHAKATAREALKSDSLRESL